MKDSSFLSYLSTSKCPNKEIKKATITLVLVDKGIKKQRKEFKDNSTFG